MKMWKMNNSRMRTIASISWNTNCLFILFILSIISVFYYFYSSTYCIFIKHAGVLLYQINCISLYLYPYMLLKKNSYMPCKAMAHSKQVTQNQPAAPVTGTIWWNADYFELADALQQSLYPHSPLPFKTIIQPWYREIQHYI